MDQKYEETDLKFKEIQQIEILKTSKILKVKNTVSP